MKPVIGITVECAHDPDDVRTRGNFSLNWNYAQAIAEAGGLPVVIPPMADPAEIAPMLDGLLIPGGSDIDASNWGEANHPKAKVKDPNRFQSERALLERLDPNVPIFGICYGCQAMNVVRGGSLIQHVPDVVHHEQHAGGTLQSYEIQPDSRLAEALGTTDAVGKSYHHQSVGKLGEGLRVVAKHEDGVVEAIEATDRPFFIGVQWHPERTLEDPATRKLFQTFVDSAASYRDAKARG